MPLLESSYRPPLLMMNGHVSTIVPSVWRRVEGVHYERERIETPDNDFLDLDWCFSDSKNLVVITHGLEGSSKRPYVLGMAKYFRSKGWNILAWNCRSCSGEINRTIEDASAVLSKVEETYGGQAQLVERVDGLSMDMGQWRFNLRMSNTEPVVRLNVESRGDQALMQSKTEELLALIDA